MKDLLIGIGASLLLAASIIVIAILGVAGMRAK